MDSNDRIPTAVPVAAGRSVRPVGVPRGDLRCPDCGYDLRGSPRLQCPECGRRWTRRQIVVASHRELDPPLWPLYTQALGNPLRFWQADGAKVTAPTARLLVTLCVLIGAAGGATSHAVALVVVDQWPIVDAVAVWPVLMLALSGAWWLLVAVHAAVCHAALTTFNRKRQAGGWAGTSGQAIWLPVWQTCAAVLLTLAWAAVSLPPALAFLRIGLATVVVVVMITYTSLAVYGLARARGASAERAGVAVIVCAVFNPCYLPLVWVLS